MDLSLKIEMFKQLTAKAPLSAERLSGYIKNQEEFLEFLKSQRDALIKPEEVEKKKQLKLISEWVSENPQYNGFSEPITECVCDSLYGFYLDVGKEDYENASDFLKDTCFQMEIEGKKESGSLLIKISPSDCCCDDGEERER